MTHAIALALLLLAHAGAIEPEKHGCEPAEGNPNVYFCKEGAIAQLGCTALRRVEELEGLGVDALECVYPLPATEPPAEERVIGVRPHGGDIFGPATSTTCLLIRDGSELRLLTSRGAFVDRFAPVESPEEALAFAILLTGLPRHRTSDVVRRGDAYLVRHLFSTGAGCVTMPPQGVDVTVYRNGGIDPKWIGELPER